MVIPISDDNPTLRTPVVTIAILAALGAVWLWVQRAGFDAYALAASVCDYGMVPGEVTGLAPLGQSVPLSETASCVVDRDPINVFTPLTSMFLHGGWLHLLGNSLFLWIFGNNVEDSMGRIRFPIFYLLCGLAAAGAQILVDPSSAVPTVGASGAISGIMGAYVVLYPRARVNVFVFIIIIIRIVPVPAWLMLLFWFGEQFLAGLPQLNPLNRDVSAGVAYWAHVGGFLTGVVLVKLFENRRLVSEKLEARRYYRAAP